MAAFHPHAIAGRTTKNSKENRRPTSATSVLQVTAQLFFSTYILFYILRTLVFYKIYKRESFNMRSSLSAEKAHMYIIVNGKI